MLESDGTFIRVLDGPMVSWDYRVTAGRCQQRWGHCHMLADTNSSHTGSLLAIALGKPQAQLSMSGCQEALGCALCTRDMSGQSGSLGLGKANQAGPWLMPRQLPEGWETQQAALPVPSPQDFLSEMTH